MKSRARVIPGSRGLACAAAVLALLVGLQLNAWAKERASQATREADTSDERIEQKLDQIVANQAEILQRFDAVMEELKIIKIRASLR